MEIKTAKTNGYTEIKLIGRLDSNTSLELEKELTEIIDNGEINILIDFKDLNYISSAGLRVFLVGAKLLDPHGKKLNFCYMLDYIHEVFDIAGFSQIFNIYNTREEIIK